MKRRGYNVGAERFIVKYIKCEFGKGHMDMKKFLAVFCLLMLTLCITSCIYNPPEGWTIRPHTYKEILAFAKSMDPNATVSKKYTDIEDEYNWPYREWEAVINGVNCHVTSVSDRVWNEGVLAGEFAEFYYRIETDYDYAIVIQIKFADNYSEWKCEETVHERYQHNRIVFAWRCLNLEC